MERARTRRSASVTIGLTALLAASLSGCGEEEVTHQAVCVDQQQRRLPDAECRSGPEDDDDGYHGGHAWYYVPVGARYPAVGETADGGTFRSGGGMVVGDGGLSARGGVARGGFGGSGGHGGG
jgi:hypothetical protein